MLSMMVSTLHALQVFFISCSFLTGRFGLGCRGLTTPCWTRKCRIRWMLVFRPLKVSSLCFLKFSFSSGFLASFCQVRRVLRCVHSRFVWKTQFSNRAAWLWAENSRKSAVGRGSCCLRYGRVLMRLAFIIFWGFLAFEEFLIWQPLIMFEGEHIFLAFDEDFAVGGDKDLAVLAGSFEDGLGDSMLASD